MTIPPLKLPRRMLGSSGIEVSCLGLGTVKIGRNSGVKYPAGFQLPDDNEVSNILQVAGELGINLIDTAPAYGSSEERLGKLLHNRSDWVICSKVGEEFQNNQSFHDFTAAAVRRSIERSLRRLRTDYLDIVLVHSDGEDEAIINDSDCFAALQQCREAGLIRSFGLSGKTVAGGLLALEHSDVVMVTYNPQATDEEAVLDRALELQRGVLIKKALNSGHALTAQDGERDPVRRSMAFVFAHPAVSSVIVGSINPLHILHNAQAAAEYALPRGE